MGLLGSAAAEIRIDYNGQKKRHKIDSSAQLFFSVSINPNHLDPRYLGELYSSAFVKLSDILIRPGERELFWIFVNESLQQVFTNPVSICHIMPSFVDLPPVMGPLNGKAIVSITLTQMDNHKVKFKITESALAVYYVTLAPVCLMQHILNVLPPDQFAIFFDVFKERMNTEIQYSKRPDMLAFRLAPLPAATQSVSTASPTVSAPRQVSSRFCGNCGHEITLDGQLAPKFCGSCGSQLN